MERGYHAMSLDDIAARVGISKGAIYLHFSSKEDLVTALIARGTHTMLETLDSVLSGDGSPRDKLSALIEHVYGSMSNERFQVIGSIIESAELRTLMAERRQTMQKDWMRLRERMSVLVEEGRATGEFDSGISTPVMVSILSNLLSPHTYYRMVKVEHIPIEDAISQVSRFMLNGIQSKRTSRQVNQTSQ